MGPPAHVAALVMEGDLREDRAAPGRNSELCGVTTVTLTDRQQPLDVDQFNLNRLNPSSASEQDLKLSLNCIHTNCAVIKVLLKQGTIHLTTGPILEDIIIIEFELKNSSLFD